eukprot:tig00020516_g9958.t1
MARQSKAAAAAATAEKKDNVLEPKKADVAASLAKSDATAAAGKDPLPVAVDEASPVIPTPVDATWTTRHALPGLNDGMPREGAAATITAAVASSRPLPGASGSICNAGQVSAAVPVATNSASATANGIVMLSPAKKVTVARTFMDLKDGRDFNGVVRIANMHTISGRNGGDTIRGTLEDEVGDKVPLRIFTGAMLTSAGKNAIKGDMLIDQVNNITEHLNASCNSENMYLIMKSSNKARYLVKGTATEKLAWPLTRDRTLLKEIQINSGNVGLINFESVNEEDPRLIELPHKLANMDRASFVMMRYDIVSDFRGAAVDYMNVNKLCDSNRFSEYNIGCIIKEEEDGYVCMDKLGCKVPARFGLGAKFESLGELFDTYSIDGVADIVVSFAEFKFERPSGTPTELWFGFFSEVMGLAEFEEKKKTLPVGFVSKAIKIPDASARLHASVPFGNGSNRVALFAGGTGPTGSTPNLSGTTGIPVKVGNAMNMPMQLRLSLKDNPFAVSRDRTGSEASFPNGLVEREATIAKRKKGGKDEAKTSKKQKNVSVESESDAEVDDEEEEEN